MVHKSAFSHKNLSVKVVDYLKEQILLENYEGGERIQADELAAELGISQVPVREGIKQLANQGLIKNVPRKGSFVEEFEEEDIQEIFEIRVLLEERILEILIKNSTLTEEDFRYLRRMIDEMVAIAKKGSETRRVEVSERDIEFHKYLWERSGSRRSVNILSNLYYQLQIAMIRDAGLEPSLLDSAKKHYAILDHLRNEDLESAKKALESHIFTYRQRIKS